MIRLNYELFKPYNDLRICWVQSTAGLGRHRRKDLDNAVSVDSFGARAIRDEMPWSYDIVTLDKIANYDFAFISLTSVVEIENILRDIAKAGANKGKCQVVLGGMGCLNIWPLRDLADIAVFGRAEGQIESIIDGATPPNVWRKLTDSWIEGQYEIRQASQLLPGERGVGCPNRCTYCQYTHVRRHLPGRGYRAGGIKDIHEDDWNRIEFKQGRNITAWDGLSEATRRRAHKAITDKAIATKLSELRERQLPKTVNIKIFNIVGYPWETPESYNSDMDAAYELLRSADGPGGRIFIMMLHTPFSPEPYTPMQDERVEFYNWRDIANARGRQIYKGENIEAMVLPQIAGPHTLQRRIALNRANRNNYKDIARWVVESKTALPDFYNVFGIGDSSGIPNLVMPSKEV